MPARVGEMVIVGELSASPADPSALFASPKSSTFTVPSGVILMLAGFRSRWTIPFACAISRAAAICRAIFRTSSRGSGPRGESLDPGRLELRGNPIPVLDDVDGNVIAGNGRFDFSLTGTFIYLSGNTLGSPSSLVWMDASGKTENVMPPRATMSPRVSPDAHYSITGKLGEGGMGAGRQLDRISRGWRWQARQDRGAGRRAGRAVRRRLRNGSELDRRRPYRLRAWQPQRSGQDLRFGLRRAKMLRVPAGAIAGGRGGRQRVGSR